MTSNNQGELSPLEIGIHALKAVPKEQGGRGKKGGLSEYAQRLGKSEASIRFYVQAAEVVKETSHICAKFLDSTRHLAAIHKLPRPCWQSACEWLAANEASVADVEAKVKAAAEVFLSITENLPHVRQVLQECRERDDFATP